MIQFAGFWVGAAGIAACGPAMDPSTGLGKQAIVDQASIALSRMDCDQAVALLKPVYASKYTDNRIRMLMAAAYGCNAHINLFNVVGDLSSNLSKFVGSGFWEFLATEFPSTTKDRVVEGAQLAQDAVQSIISPSAVILPVNIFNATTDNPGTLSPRDRVDDANSYLFFVVLASIGGLENRYGNPYPNGKKGGDLAWISDTVAHMAAPADFNAVDGSQQQSDGCAYASAMVNLVDSLGGLATATAGTKLSDTFTTLQTTFKTGIFAACNDGCTSLCSVGACLECPTTLRNRSSCTGLTTDPNSCAAAGIINFINNTPAVGWETGP
ncbi:hypothetical protein WDW37_08240 [Bdellovibrionota bacterium FG-1]